jgi:hypothetical protein
MKSNKSSKGLKQAHTSNAKKGMGDYYGTGIKQKMGRLRDGLDSQPSSYKKLGKPPKSLA